MIGVMVIVGGGSQMSKTNNPTSVFMNKPGILSRWIHNNGNRYVVIGYANEATENPDKYPVTVIYMGENNLVWCRPLDDWHRSMSLISTGYGHKKSDK